MNPDQPNPFDTNTQPEVPAEQTPPLISPKKTPLFKRKGFLIPVLILIFLLLAGGATYAVVSLQKDDTPKTSTQTDTKETEDTKATIDNIYVYSSAELVAINPETKEFVVVDKALEGESSNASFGSTTPLTAPNFKSAVYIKGNTGWIVTGTEKKTFYSIPDTAKNTGFYTLYLSAWSSDSTKIAFSIGFMCPPYGSPCNEESEDKNLTGVYVYDVATNKTSKARATGVLQWIPGTSKLAYFDDATTPQKLLVNDTSTDTTAVLATKSFGFGTQASISDDAQKILYTAGVNGTESAATFISNIDGTEQKTLKTSSFADLQWPKFLPESSLNYVYSKRKEVTCYENVTGCVSASLHVVKDGQDKKAVEDIDYRVIGFYKNQAVVVISDGQIGLSPNNPAPYKAGIYLVNLDSFSTSKIYEKVSQKGGDTDLQLKLRIGE